MVCKDCERREIGCHAQCEDYAKYREEIKKTAEEKKYAELCSYKRQSMHRKGLDNAK